jgi:hypothetical protein
MLPTVMKTPPLTASVRTGPVTPRSVSSSRIRRAPAARSAGGRPSTRARSTTIGRLKNVSVAGWASRSMLIVAASDACGGPGAGCAASAPPTPITQAIAIAAPRRSRSA